MDGLDLLSEFAALLIELRTTAQLSQEEAAEGVGVARSTEIRWEHGKMMPSITNIRKIAAFYNIPDHRLKPFLANYKK